MGTPLDAIRAVAAVLAADGKIGEDEMDFLERIAKGLAVPPDAVESVLDEVRNGELTLEFPEDVGERKSFFNVMLDAARADGEVAPKEQKLLELVASRLGVVDVGGDKA